MVVVGGREPLRWSSKQLGYLAKISPQKTPANNNNNNKNNNDKTTCSTTNCTLEPRDYQDNPKREWKHVTRKMKPSKTPPTTIELPPATAAETTTAEATAKVTIEKEKPAETIAAETQTANRNHSTLTSRITGQKIQKEREKEEHRERTAWRDGDINKP